MSRRPAPGRRAAHCLTGLVVAVALVGPAGARADGGPATAKASFERAEAAHSRALEAVADADRRAAYEEALDGFLACAREHPRDPTWTRATFLASVVLAEGLGRPADALVQLQTLLADERIDRDERGQPYAPARNERHHAWRMVSTCELALGHCGPAFDATIAMRSAFVPTCPCCHEGMLRLVGRRLADIARPWLDVPPDTAAADALAARIREVADHPADEILWALGQHAARSPSPRSARAPLDWLLSRCPDSAHADDARRVRDTLPR